MGRHRVATNRQRVHFISDDDRECIVVPVAYFENSVVFAAGDDYPKTDLL